VLLEKFGAGQTKDGIAKELKLFMVELEASTGVGEGSRENHPVCWLELTKRQLKPLNQSFKLVCSVLIHWLRISAGISACWQV